MDLCECPVVSGTGILAADLLGLVVWRVGATWERLLLSGSDVAMGVGPNIALQVLFTSHVGGFIFVAERCKCVSACVLTAPVRMCTVPQACGPVCMRGCMPAWCRWAHASAPSLCCWTAGDSPGRSKQSFQISCSQWKFYWHNMEEFISFIFCWQ